MVTEFKNKPVKFSLKDIGSKVIDQISSDIYSNPGAIMRELVKNAYDSYLDLNEDEFEDESLSREIIISRERDSRGVGRIFVADHGVGLTVDELKTLVQISISKKPVELANATGFRGLGSWAILGAGSKVIITSVKKDYPYEARLTINVRDIYKIMSSETTLDDILNNPQCISFGERENNETLHGTIVEIVCDGKPAIVNGHELNRLYAYTDPKNVDLRKLLVETSPIPFSSEGGAYKEIHEIYRETGYVPTQIILDGNSLERGLPADLTELEVRTVFVNNRPAAKAWTANSPKYSGEVRGINEDKHLLNGPSIQLMKLNVPIGPKGIFSSGVVRSNILKGYVGEVHIILPDVMPDADGQDLRAGTARETFIQALQGFYETLDDQAEDKSARISMDRKLRQAMEAAEELTEKQNELSTHDKVILEGKIATAVKIIEETASRRKPRTKVEEQQRKAAQDPQVKERRKQARQFLQEKSLFDKYSSIPSRPSSTKAKKARAGKKAKPTSANQAKSQRVISFDELQSRIGLAVPRFTEVGLSPDQIDQILQILEEVVLGEQ